MNDRKFLHEVASSAMDPNKRKYQKIKIKVTQDEYQLEVKCSDKNEQMYRNLKKPEKECIFN